MCDGGGGSGVCEFYFLDGKGNRVFASRNYQNRWQCVTDQLH